MEINIGVIGAVDNAKTTTISCLKFDQLDDGRGQARLKIMQFPHEKDTGRTSSISKIHLPVNDDHYVTFIDLAGHEKYLRTTLHGITGHNIDYAMIVVGANMGVTRMTREHLNVVISLKIPLFFVVTKIDICPANILAETMEGIATLLKKTKRYTLGHDLIESPDAANQILNLYRNKEFYNICPVFQTSNKTGHNLDLLKHFINNLPTVHTYVENLSVTRKIFRVHDKFNVRGVGFVVSGIVIEGQISKGDQLYIGPVYGQWARATIKSIHDNFKNEMGKLVQHQSGCLAVSFTDKKLKINSGAVRKGVIICDQPYPLSRNFIAQIAITMGHSTTIRPNYQPIIHCKTIVQAARIYEMDHPLVRSGDVCKVRFQFQFRPEFINAGDIFIFREGNLRGIGKISEILPDQINNNQHFLTSQEGVESILANVCATREARKQLKYMSRSKDKDKDEVTNNIETIDTVIEREK
jgi:GTPase